MVERNWFVVDSKKLSAIEGLGLGGAYRGIKERQIVFVAWTQKSLKELGVTYIIMMTKIQYRCVF